MQNLLLAGMSVVFYSWGSLPFVFLLLTSVFANYVFAIFAATDDAQKRKIILAFCVIFNIGSLCVFKYANFIVENLNFIPGFNIPNPNIPLPIGISFFTFQAMSYVLDVGSGKIKPQRNLISLLLYISFFPQLIAGPVVRYIDIEPRLQERSPTVRDAAFGIRRFIFGLSKKLLIANMIGSVADAVFGVDAEAIGDAVGSVAVQGFIGETSSAFPIVGATAWLGAIAYTLQIYYDFSGYSDMAIGLGRMFGFHFRENFEYPYMTFGIRDFWRKWHISLSTWFRDYVYIPLGGNRLGKLREVINKLTVFLLTGLWHGANWTFVAWGLYHGFFLTLESYRIIQPQKIPKIIAWLYSIIVVTTGFVIFRSAKLSDAGHMLSAMYSGFHGNNLAQEFGQALTLLKPSMLPAFVIAIIAMFPLKKVLVSRIPKAQIFGFALSVPLFFLCVLDLSTATYNQFIYYRF